MKKPTPEQSARIRAVFLAKFGDNPPKDWAAWRRGIVDQLTVALEEVEDEATRGPKH